MINNGLLCVWIILASYTAIMSLWKYWSIAVIWNITKLWGGATELRWNTTKCRISIRIGARELSISAKWNTTAKWNVSIARLCILIRLWIAWCWITIGWIFRTKTIAERIMNDWLIEIDLTKLNPIEINNFEYLR